MAIFKPINNIRLLNVLYKFKIKIIINKKDQQSINQIILQIQDLLKNLAQLIMEQEQVHEK